VLSSSPPAAPPPPPDPDPRIREWSIASRELRADVGIADIAMAGVLVDNRNANAARPRRAAAVG